MMKMMKDSRKEVMKNHQIVSKNQIAATTKETEIETTDESMLIKLLIITKLFIIEFYSDIVYDFDLMMQRKKEENYRRRKRRNIDIINDSDDVIAELITQMKQAADVRLPS